MEKQYHEWLINWFSQRGEVPGETEEEKLNVNYFDEGLIDSLTVFSLITDIEEHFQVHFTERHFQDLRFSTIGGISEIVGEIKCANG